MARRDPAPRRRTADPSADNEARNGYQRDVLTRGWRLRALLRELAEGEKPQSQLAREYGVTQGRISQIKKKHILAIEQIQDDLENEFAGMWIAQKQSRLAEMQSDIEDINDNPERYDTPEFRRLKLALLKQAAEELGQIPSKVQAAEIGKILRIAIEGIDLDDLR